MERHTRFCVVVSANAHTQKRLKQYDLPFDTTEQKSQSSCKKVEKPTIVQPKKEIQL